MLEIYASLDGQPVRISFERSDEGFAMKMQPANGKASILELDDIGAMDIAISLNSLFRSQYNDTNNDRRCTKS